MSHGFISLVGAGPGDPGLVTVKALACIREADTVVYDFLANPCFLREAAADAELICVGKRGGQHTMRQPDINCLLVDLGTGARSHRCDPITSVIAHAASQGSTAKLCTAPDDDNVTIDP